MSSDEPLCGWADEAERFSEHHPAQPDQDTPSEWQFEGSALADWERIQEHRRRFALRYSRAAEMRNRKAPAPLSGWADSAGKAVTPPPKRGGTFFYCPWTERPKPGTVTSCGVLHARYNGTRFRTEAAYRRHWRRYHT